MAEYIWRAKLRGTSFEGRQANIDLYLREGQELFWFHESDNAFDSNAIHVYTDESKSLSLGHLSKAMAKHFVERKAQNCVQRIFCEQITGKDKPRKGVNIKVVIRTP